MFLLSNAVKDSPELLANGFDDLISGFLFRFLFILLLVFYIQVAHGL